MLVYLPPLSLCAWATRLLHADREPVPDVAAVYFVEPKADNIDRIAKARPDNGSWGERMRGRVCVSLCVSV
jgi:hypothetical protein